MTNPGPGATLSIHDNNLRINGNGPISAVFTNEMVHKLFKLPARPELIWFNQRTLSAFDVLSRLTKQAMTSFVNVANSNSKLREIYDYKVKHFAAYAHPATGWWPNPDNLMVLETIPVDLPFLLYITWMLDGSVMLGRMTDNNTLSLTPEEFRCSTGETYQEYGEKYLPLHIDKCQRALALLAIGEPKKAVVSFINKASAFEKKTMIYWQADQVDQYLHRNELSHIATEPEDQPNA